MEIIEQLKVTPQDFFEQISRSVCMDIRQAENRMISADEIHPDYEYRKTMKNKMGMKGSVRIRITDFSAPEIYKAEFINGEGTTSISYRLAENMDGGCQVTYCEEYVSAKKLNSLNQKLMMFLYKRSARKKAVSLIRAIEAYILQTKGEQLCA